MIENVDAPVSMNEKMLNSFIKEVIDRNRRDLPLYSMPNQDDDDDDDSGDESCEGSKQNLFSMAFANRVSSHELIPSSEENYSQIIPLKFKRWKTSVRDRLSCLVTLTDHCQCLMTDW